MKMISLTYENIKPYLNKPRIYDLNRFIAIQKFVKDDLSFQYFQSIDGEWDTTGSCSTLKFYFDKDWLSVERNWQGSDTTHFFVKIGISARGPFITSIGLELQPAPPGEFRPPLDGNTAFLPSAKAQETAQKIGKEIAEKFNCLYIEAEWLNEYEIDVMDLTGDASLSLEDANPIALNVLFSEYM
jgi:hypothetical protein